MESTHNPPNLDDPPPNFKPGTDENNLDPDKLELYGFPPRPEGSEEGITYWKDAMQAIGEYRVPPPPIKPSKILESRTWSGAIVPSQPLNSPHHYLFPPPQKPGGFYYITSSWIIPDACPPPQGNPQGEYACYACIGFDGWGRMLPPIISTFPGANFPQGEAPPALLGGTKSIYTRGSHCAKVFLQYNHIQEVFDEPVVRPGDLVSAFVWIHDGLGRFPCFKTFRFFIVNRNTGQYSRIWRKLPDDFKGSTAEWILGRQDLDYGNPGFPTEALPNYGATYFQKNFADYQGRRFGALYLPHRILTVDNADLIDMIEQKGKKKEIISTAKKVGPNLLNVYAYKDE
jgi:hypothetical protein